MTTITSGRGVGKGVGVGVGVVVRMTGVGVGVGTIGVGAVTVLIANDIRVIIMPTRIIMAIMIIIIHTTCLLIEDKFSKNQKDQDKILIVTL